MQGLHLTLIGIWTELMLLTRKNSTPNKVLFFLARPAGFEPATYRFVAGHSIR